MCGILAHSDGPSGSSLIHIPAPGTTVLCHKRDNTFSDICVIIGMAGTSYVAASNSCNADKCLSGVEPVTSADLGDMDTTVNSLLPEHFRSLLYTTGVQLDRDAMPGDTDIANKNGTAGMHIGQYIAQLVGGYGALMELSGMDSKASLIAENIGVHTLATQDMIVDALRVRNTAATLSEAMGYTDGGGYLGDGSKKHRWALPYYRTTEMEGEAAGGYERLVLSPLGHHSDVHTLLSNPKVLAKTRQSYTGELSQASMFGMSSIKTLDIGALLQYRYNKPLLPDDDGFDDEDLDILQQYPEPEEAYAEPEHSEMDEALFKLESKVLTRDYMDQLIDRMRERGLVVAKEAVDEQGDPIEDYGVPPHGPTNDQSYGTPPFVEIAGKRYYNAPSFITQEPNGDILICDGYGSEIRMSHGNIIISPALDLQIRPGRDMHALAPGYMALESGKTFSLEVNEGDLLMHSPGDLKISGATGDKNSAGGLPSITIECGPNSRTEQRQMVVKSSGDLSVTGAGDVVVGRASASGSAVGELEDPGYAGALVLQAGATGTLVEKAESKLVEAPDIAVTQGRGANAVVMNGTRINVYTGALSVFGGFRTARQSQPTRVSTYSGGEIRDIPAYHATEARAEIAGSLTVSGRLETAKGARFNGSIAANGVISNSKNNVRGRNYGKNRRTPWYVDEIEVLDNSKATPVGVYASTVLREAARGIFQSKALLDLSFAWPLYPDVTRDYVPCTVWQKRNIDNEAKYKGYAVKYIKNSEDMNTAPYPGFYNIHDGFMPLGDEQYPVQGGYVTNIHQ